MYSSNRRRTCADVAYTHRWNGFCGLPHCSLCQEPEEEPEEVRDTSFETLHVARQAFTRVRLSPVYVDGKFHGTERKEGSYIEPGDIYARVTGFSYREDGERLDYHRPTKRLVAKGPGREGHDPERWAQALELREKQLARRRAKRQR